MADEQDSLAQLVRIIREHAPAYADLLTADTEAQFDEALDAHFESVVADLEANAKNLSGLPENGLTAYLVRGLKQPGLHVSQETNSNGHVDVTIETVHTRRPRRRLAEAKIYHGPEKHYDGMGQLLIRYSTGRFPRGFMISYHLRPNIAGKVKELRKRMDDDRPHQQQGQTSDHPVQCWFESNHLHASGETLKVGHIGCNLHCPQSSTEQAD